jgi:hypothetical protein
MQARSKVTHLNHSTTFDNAEEVVRYLSVRIISDWRTYAQIAEGVGCAPSTIANIATNTTRWPRPATLFGLIHFYKLKLRIETV